MMDVIFIVTAVAFFALMAAYVAGCRALGQDRSSSSGEPQ